MSQTVKWALALGLSALVALGLVGMATAWKDVEAAAQTVRALEKEGAGLAGALRQAETARRDLESWNAVQALARQAGLEADQWLFFPVSIGQEVSADGLNQMLALASLGRPRGGRYWFLPQSFSFARLAVASGGPSPAPAAPAAPGGSAASSPVPDAHKIKKYHGQMQGVFLSRKPAVNSGERE